jgi:hypothetical protein
VRNPHGDGEPLEKLGKRARHLEHVAHILDVM